jgi:hypothetical protein
MLVDAHSSAGYCDPSKSIGVIEMFRERVSTYHGYEVVTGEPQYGSQFRYAWRVDDESQLHFCPTIVECMNEIDEHYEERSK